MGVKQCHEPAMKQWVYGATFHGYFDGDDAIKDDERTYVCDKDDTSWFY